MSTLQPNDAEWDKIFSSCSYLPEEVKPGLKGYLLSVHEDTLFDMYCTKYGIFPANLGLAKLGASTDPIVRALVDCMKRKRQEHSDAYIERSDAHMKRSDAHNEKSGMWAKYGALCALAAAAIGAAILYITRP